MTDSILNTIKAMLNVPPQDTAFDNDILVHINSAISTLSQLGVGPTSPVLVVDADTEWTTLTSDVTIQGLTKSFIYLSVKLVFDPPGTSYGIDSAQRQLGEVTWRIEVQANPYVPPVVPPEEV